jgi:DNA mismatch repair protein MutL
MLMTGRYPVAVIMIELPPGDVDVNVHPTKAEIRFREKESVFRAVQRAVRRALVDLGPARPAELAAGAKDVGWAVGAALAKLRPSSHFQAEMELSGGTAGLRSEPGLLPTSSEQLLPVLRVVGQIGATYIVAEGPGELVLVDQHAAHERILYEQFMAQRTTGVEMQTLLEPISVELAPDRAALLEGHLEILGELGFMVEHFGGATFMVRGLPALLGEISPLDALEAVVDDLEQGKKPLEETVEERLIGRICRTAAIKAGQVLTLQEMSAMIRQLEACASPHTCPHGRPTMIQMSSEQLAKQFRRL